MRASKLIIITAIFAFASVISFFQIDSYWADKNHFNGLIGWLGIGIVTGIIAIYFLYRTVKAGGVSKSHK